AKGAIDAAKDSDGVNQTKADGIKAMDDQHKSGDPVENRKENAKTDKNNRFNKDNNPEMSNDVKIKNNNQFPKTGESSSFKIFIFGIFCLIGSFLGVLKIRK
ncbi:LPXTG cell wall anchor domain-containing protein, partial [Enterococcus faecalis]|uniref:LPXTG cell wall anchor domain-containing protein n=1 Tax=Enterococcus faecalis TaxID=1351 RepID=UPI003CC5263F